MQNKLKTIIHLLLIFTIILACSEEQKDSSSIESQDQNSNYPSELALLMREMLDEAMEIKQRIDNGDSITLDLDHDKILTAHATDTVKAASTEYKAFAYAYLQSMKSLQTAGSTQSDSLFENMVENCMACHKALCPGPIMRIEKLQQPLVVK